MTRIRAAADPKLGMRGLRDEVLGRFLTKSRPNWTGAGPDAPAGERRFIPLAIYLDNRASIYMSHTTASSSCTAAHTETIRL